MNAVEVATNGSFARVGGGAVTADVYSALDERNLSFVGGRVGSVGVGGFATGGGTSPLASRNGWAVNSIYEYEVSRLLCTCESCFADSRRSFYRTLRS